MRQLDLLVKTPLSEAIDWTLIHFVWEGIVIASTLAALLALIRLPRIRYLAGCVALLAMVISFALTLFHFLPARNSGAGTLV